jgi:hypothetical protein
MIGDRQQGAAVAKGWDAPRRRLGLAVLLLVSVLVVAGCSPGAFRRQPPQAGRTTLSAPLVILPAQVIGNYLLVEAKGDRSGPYHFLIDTGSSVTLVTPALARRHPGPAVAAGASRVRVAGADGRVSELPRGSLRRIELGGARFEDVDVLIYDCAAISAHLGVRIDGVLGFPLFRETLLTLDYPRSRVSLQPSSRAIEIPGTVVPFDDARKTPVITVNLGDRSLVALVDSGSDAWFSLNPVGVSPVFAAGPALGATIGSLGGEHTQRVGRLAETLVIGGQPFERPVVDLTDELSAVGGGVLRHFSVSFDQLRDRVIFHRDVPGLIECPPLRSAGVSFSKTPAYWRVAGVVPRSPAEAEGMQPGDLVIRINGEPVASWDFRRFETLLAESEEMTVTLLNGSTELDRRLRFFELIP